MGHFNNFAVERGWIPPWLEFSKDVYEKISSLGNDWKNIDVLINNAGNAHGLDFIHEGKIEDWDMMIDTNVKGLLYVSKPVLDIMTKNLL